MSKIIDFESFVRFMEESLGLDPSLIEIKHDTSLVIDLGLDSLSFVEAMAALEELGVRIGDEDMIRIESVGDLYQLYAVRKAAPG